MRFSEKWLREWVNPPVSTDELAAQLTMAGLEVDSVEPAAPPFESVVVGEVMTVAPHPDADKLRVCHVQVGAGEPLQIICGAPNVYAGMKAPTAQVGAVLPGGLKIKKAKLRGVESFGMLCSARELGLSEEHEGLLDLPADAPTGTDIREYLGLDDSLIEVDLTPNRGDCLGIAGIAREVGALNGCAVEGPDIYPVEEQTSDQFPVEVEAPGGCPRYIGRVIRGVRGDADTPLWMQERLRRSGLRSLGPLVDVTNYVLLELGQPMHAFDLGRLEGGIRVRYAESGESLVLLDGRRVELDADTLVIADHAKPLAIAGVMGGEHSGVSEQTGSLFLECAYFAPEAVAGRARRYGLQTDSSYRFERGVDPRLQKRAMERATALLLDIVGGEAGPTVEDVSRAHLPARTPIRLRAERIRRLLGMAPEPAAVSDILSRLGAQGEATEEGWQVVPPSYRFDLAIEADLIEDIGRIYGYNRLPSTRPRGALAMAPAPEATVGRERLLTLLVDRGYQEAITYSFVDDELQKLLDPDHEGLSLANPLSSELSVMRTSLWPGLIKALQHNHHRQQSRVRLFEWGLRFIQKENELEQETMIAGLASGDRYPEQWGAPVEPGDFFDVKADVEALLEAGGCVGQFQFAAERHPALHPGQSARIYRDGTPVGWLGCIHPRLTATLDIPENTYVFELDGGAVLAGAVPRFQEVSRFPAIRRDLAIVVSEEINAQAICQAVRNTAGPALQELRVFDVYRGKGIESGRKSIAFGLILQDSSRTLTDKDVDAVISAVTTQLRDHFGATLRE
ncbi:MAG TPA: phenylalanine--tRNA ligase subunit beta [Gammaproteobacteria bacterium]|nr:phenylalanine--tRNA ligase subunit beta [Gammaproteobacteria bacterium]